MVCTSCELRVNIARAEGATTPETLRPKGPLARVNSEERSDAKFLSDRHTEGANLWPWPHGESLRSRTEGVSDF